MGIRLLTGELVRDHGLRVVQDYMGFIRDNARKSVERLLSTFMSSDGGSSLRAEDSMDDGSKICLKVDIDVGAKNTYSATFDFTGTSLEVLGNWNCPPAVVKSAIVYCLRLYNIIFRGVSLLFLRSVADI